MYASKRRQRNFKRVREPAKPGAATNPSKRHRERLNGELETVAALLPYDATVISRLDKLSVLRLAVSFLQVKAHFQGAKKDPEVELLLDLPLACMPDFGAILEGLEAAVVTSGANLAKAIAYRIGA
ncbi:hypothetical protein QR680_009195 [Steinernema hermaphroditum]|uniref:BHLH domain-containing protein n=1 Tax=Steinernema hermaphroditum TaxID=289476 RepID=A0AA39ILH1_9BILA|nr:hypothetical protein QR680_009195 [Steinernema hermaphroditum]